MGIHDREYLRDDAPGFGSLNPSAAPWGVCQKLIAITIVVFIAQLMVPIIEPWLILSPQLLMQGHVWSLLTYAFLHNPLDILHLLFNMMMLYFFGRQLESMYGGREFATFYCASAIFAGLCYLAWGQFINSPAPIMGASGATMAVVLLFALHFPRQQVLMFGVFPIEMRWLATLIILFDMLPVLNQLSGGVDNSHIAHMAHLGGVLFAFLYYKTGIRLSRWTSFGNSSVGSMLQSRPKLKIFREETPEDLDQKVDQILAKVSQHGEASLTRQERQILTRASEKYKNRR